MEQCKFAKNEKQSQMDWKICSPFSRCVAGSKFTKLLKQICKIFVFLGLKIFRLLSPKLVFDAEIIKGWCKHCKKCKWSFFHEWLHCKNIWKLQKILQVLWIYTLDFKSPNKWRHQFFLIFESIPHYGTILIRLIYCRSKIVDPVPPKGVTSFTDGPNTTKWGNLIHFWSCKI